MANEQPGYLSPCSTLADAGGTPSPGEPMLRPSSVENRPVFSRKDLVAYGLLTTVIGLALADFLIGWFTTPDWGRHPMVLACLSVPLLGSLALRASRWLLLPVMRSPVPMEARPGLRVGVATTFVPGVEPPEMLETTLKALIAMDYPHDTWVLDEGDDVRVKAICERLGAFHFSRKHLERYRTDDGLFQTGCKHGNFNAWLFAVGFDRYDIISGFDPDHVPVRDFLTSVLGYFEDSEIAYVQAPQAYGNVHRSPVARGAAEESYAFYSCDEPAAYAAGYPIIIGCHNTHRISALRQVGGYAPHFADDVLLTMLYQRSGWKGVYVPRVMAVGEAPEDWGTYVRQQRRWARSLLDLKLRVYPKITAAMPAGARALGLVHGLGFLKEGIFTALLILAVVTALVGGACLESGLRSPLARGLMLVAAMIPAEIFVRRFYLHRSWRLGLQWRSSLVRFAKWPFLLMAMFDVLAGRRLPYVPTPKARGRRSGGLVLWPHGLTVAAVAAAMAAGWMRFGAPCPLVFSAAIVLAAVSAGLMVHELVQV